MIRPPNLRNTVGATDSAAIGYGATPAADRPILSEAHCGSDHRPRLLRRRQDPQQPGGAGAGGNELGFGVGQQADQRAGGLRLLAGLSHQDALFRNDDGAGRRIAALAGQAQAACVDLEHRRKPVIGQQFVAGAGETA